MAQEIEQAATKKEQRAREAREVDGRPARGHKCEKQSHHKTFTLPEFPKFGDTLNYDLKKRPKYAATMDRGKRHFNCAREISLLMYSRELVKRVLLPVATGS